MNFAEQLKDQLNIVEVVGQYVRLKRQGAGQRWVGLCPFHSEKTPSFGVHSGHQYFKCFGCDAAGDVFKFVQQIESLTFPETLRLLAERYGIAMPERQRMDDPEAQRIAALLEIHEAAAEIFQENLRGPSGQEARAYVQSRGISADTAREFRLGLSDSSWQQLTQRLKRFGEALLVESGLVMKREEGPGVYDRFRSRLMFPIHNASGKVIAFGGRALLPDEKVKYINSPETKLYTKSSVLYNMHRAKIAARKNDRMILVEGYMDAIGIYTAGFQEVLAVCGTALGSGQIRSIKQELSYQSGKGHVILNLDSDAAGVRSTEKHISMLLGQGLRVKVLEIPGELDPDEYIQANGADAYGKLIERAPSYFHWLTDYARKKFDMHTAEGRVDAFKLILPAVEQVHDRIERAAIATEIAEQLGVDREIVRQALRQKPGSQTSQRPREVVSAAPPNEKLLIACMLSSADARAVVRHYLSESDSLERLELKTIFQAILSSDTPDHPFSLDRVMDSLDAHLQRIVTEIGFAESGMTEDHAPEQALHCLKLLEAKSVQAKCQDLKKRIRKLELQQNFGEALRLMDELDRVSRASARL
jgi:DNA primase